MKTLNNLLMWFLKLFFRRMEAVTWLMLFIGAVTVCLASAMSAAPIAATVKAKMPFALLTNVVCVIFIVFKSKTASLNRQELLGLLEQQSVTSGQVLRKHGFLIFGYLNLLFWGGWLICGLLLIVFLGSK